MFCVQAEKCCKNVLIKKLSTGEKSLEVEKQGLRICANLKDECATARDLCVFLLATLFHACSYELDVRSL